MKTLATEHFNLVSGGLTDSEIRMQSEGGSVFCPNNICPTIGISGPMNYNSLSPSGWDNLIGAAAGAAVGFTVLEYTAIALGVAVAAVPAATVMVIGVAAAAAGVAFQYGLAYAQQPSVTYTVGRSMSGLTGEP